MAKAKATKKDEPQVPRAFLRLENGNQPPVELMVRNEYDDLANRIEEATRPEPPDPETGMFALEGPTFIPITVVRPDQGEDGVMKWAVFEAAYLVTTILGFGEVTEEVREMMLKRSVRPPNVGSPTPTGGPAGGPRGPRGIVPPS